MKLHEYQAKEVFQKAGIAVPKGRLLTSSDKLGSVLEEIPGPPWVIKAQVHAGGRGKGGGVRLVKSPEEAEEAVSQLLEKPLVTPQTTAEGVIVHQLLVEEGVDIDREFYLGMTVDRKLACPTMIFSPSGGMEIEEVAKQSPGLIFKEPADPVTGWMPYQARNLIYRLSPLPQGTAVRQLSSVMKKIFDLFISNDCSLLEINPLVITKQGDVVALDAKMTIDDNALYRHKDLAEMDDPREKDPLEVLAEAANLNYIRLNGNIGAMVNGAGLAMATMDVIKLAGAEPANFLDVGGGASEEMITKGFEIILKDERVKAILINIFGGILRCDVLARGVLEAAKKTDINVPLIVRLEGTNVEEGRRILQESGLDFLVAKDIAEAAELVAKEVRKQG
ncbi:MAG: ADP-forming succinate--CoA ligase subunit beta [Deltaproteobacteria bacterium]|nr:MAG: ADP-forming succinate--CoA ligase subunit beta [Deltaproteobacteria bacterium]RLB78379.1 MAG: ADP-forming succinate--CoA ligase subunit beta [Deltaproteobacteria bacterium]